MMTQDAKDQLKFSAVWFFWAMAHIVLFCVGVLFVAKWTIGICEALFSVSRMVGP